MQLRRFKIGASVGRRHATVESTLTLNTGLSINVSGLITAAQSKSWAKPTLRQQRKRETQVEGCRSRCDAYLQVDDHCGRNDCAATNERSRRPPRRVVFLSLKAELGTSSSQPRTLTNAILPKAQ